MPCTKKFEAPELRDRQDTDYVLTTRELLRMTEEAGIDFANLKRKQIGMSFTPALAPSWRHRRDGSCHPLRILPGNRWTEN